MHCVDRTNKNVDNVEDCLQHAGTLLRWGAMEACKGSHADSQKVCNSIVSYYGTAPSLCKHTSPRKASAAPCSSSITSALWCRSKSQKSCEERGTRLRGMTGKWYSAVRVILEYLDIKPSNRRTGSEAAPPRSCFQRPCVLCCCSSSSALSAALSCQVSTIHTTLLSTSLRRSSHSFE